jgi:hypothetical protein
VHIVGEGATELIHIGQAVLNLDGGLDYFVENTFNYPTLAEAYKIAALDAFNRMPARETPAVHDLQELAAHGRRARINKAQRRQLGQRLSALANARWCGDERLTDLCDQALRRWAS